VIREDPHFVPDSDPPPEASRVRYRVLGMLFLLSILTFLDRVCIGSAAPLMRRDLGLTTLQMGGIFSAFSLAYAIFEIPSGWLGDRFGPRRTLTRIVIWWSAFTALTGRVGSFHSLWITRFLFGAGEAGAYPNSSCAITRWFPSVERARAQAVVWMASGLGGAIAPLIVVPLQRQLGWRNVFAIFGAFGVIWALGWYVWFRDWPEQKRGVNASEMRIIHEGASSPSAHTTTPWKALITSGNLWAVIAAYFASGYAVNFYFFWLPSYLIEVRGIQNFAPYAALPFLLGVFGNALGGWISDALVRRMGLKWGRRAVGLLGLGGSALFVLLSLASWRPVVAVVSLAMGFASANFALPNCWAVCLDIGRRHSGTVTAFMNTAAQIGGAIAGIAIGYWAGRKQWNIAIVTMAIGFLISALLYLVIDAGRPLVPEEGDEMRDEAEVEPVHSFP
jgi:MFS transporter, ACS family, glucarate transporter